LQAQKITLFIITFIGEQKNAECQSTRDCIQDIGVIFHGIWHGGLQYCHPHGLQSYRGTGLFVHHLSGIPQSTEGGDGDEWDECDHFYRLQFGRESGWAAFMARYCAPGKDNSYFCRIMRQAGAILVMCSMMSLIVPILSQIILDKNGHKKLPNGLLNRSPFLNTSMVNTCIKKWAV